MTSAKPLCIQRMDNKRGLSNKTCLLKGSTAFDVWAYEEVDAITFLKASPWHMLLKIGNQFQAYHRKHLYEFMSTKRTVLDDIGEIADTPHHQSVSIHAFNIILMGDYSIFELKPRYTVLQKTLYDVTCYTIREWNNQNPEIIVSIPDQVSEEERKHTEAILFQQMLFEQFERRR